LHRLRCLLGLAILVAAPAFWGCDADPSITGGDTGGDTHADGGADADAHADTAADGGIGSPYTEPVCELADLSAVQAAYSPAAWRDSVLPALDARYTVGAFVLRDTTEGAQCTWDSFMPSTSTFADMLDSLGTLVHEMGHCWGFRHATGGYGYLVTDTLEIQTTYLNTFPRSEIATVHEFAGTDFYFDTYLTGMSGSQGFSTVLDELNQYVHSLAVAYCYNDFRTPGYQTSVRDGPLTFLYYVEKYLEVARTVHPTDYDRILNDENAVHALDVLWGRANFYLELTRGMTTLGINDATIAGYVYSDANLDELRLVLP